MGAKHKTFTNLINRNFTVNEKNRVWCTDFTYMRGEGGKFRYNCTILDLYDRSVISSIKGNYMNAALAIETLAKALKQEKYPRGVILHSDQGVQYGSWEFVAFCRKYNIIQSMSRAGCPYDNAPMERFYNTFKNCFYYRLSFESNEKLDEMIRKYVDWYNYVRPHSYNKNSTPTEARFN